MNITDLITAAIAAILTALGGGDTTLTGYELDVDDTNAPWTIDEVPELDVITPDPPCAGEGCGDRAIEANAPAFVEETADRVLVEVGTPPAPPLTDTAGPDWTGYEYLLDPGPDTIPLGPDDGRCTPLPAGSTYPGATSWTFQPCDPDLEVIILNPCHPIDPATTWECITAYTGERRSLEPQDT